jgi:hypothetical protein
MTDDELEAMQALLVTDLALTDKDSTQASATRLPDIQGEKTVEH